MFFFHQASVGHVYWSLCTFSLMLLPAIGAAIVRLAIGPPKGVRTAWAAWGEFVRPALRAGMLNLPLAGTAW